MIHSLEVHGIKKFSSPYHFRFQPGLNIIYGSNESGKTTIQEIIFHLLYTNVNTSEAENQKSWFNKNLAQARLVYETEEQQVFRLTKDFANKKSILESYGPNGWDCISDKKEQINRLLKGQWGLIDKKVFQNTFFIKQKHLSNLEKIESLKLKEFLVNMTLGEDNYTVSQAEKCLQEQLEEINGGTRCAQKGLLKQIEKKICAWQAEEKKVERYLQEEEQNRNRLEALRRLKEEKEKQLTKLNELLEAHSSEKLAGWLKEVEKWEQKIKSMEKEIEEEAETIGSVDLDLLRNWQIVLQNESKQQVQLEKELEQEKEKGNKVIRELNLINQGLDDFIASFGEKSLEEIEKIDQIVEEENQKLQKIKAQEKKLRNRIKLQKFFTTLAMIGAFCFFPWKWWAVGIAVLIGSCWPALERRREVREQIQERQAFIYELQWRKNNILDTFFSSSKEELAQQIKRYQKQEQEICLRMKELEFQKEKINKLEQQMAVSQQKTQEIGVILGELYKKTGAQSLTQLIAARKAHKRKIGEKRDWENRLRGKLGKEDLDLGRRQYNSMLVPLQLLPEELANKVKEKENCEEEIKRLDSQISLCLSQEAVWGKQDLPSLNQIKGEIKYWQMEQQRLQEKAAALEAAREVLAEAVNEIQAQAYPQLEKAMKDIFINITNYNYDTIKVGEDFSLSVYVRDLAASVDPSLLSLGTLEQLHFALRIALGRVISQGKKLPFFLDDVLVNFDGTRRMKAMQVLAKLAKEQQIFLFTHDWQDVLPGYGNLLELPPFRVERHLEVS